MVQAELGEEPMSNEGREYPRYAIVGVGAIVLDEDRILLVKRGSEPGKGLWSIPGGVVEAGESLKNAVLRELKEETGIEGVIEGLYDVFEVIIPDKEGRVHYHYVILDFLVKPLSRIITPGSDVEETKWVRLDEALSMNLTKTTRRLIRKLLTQGVKVILKYY